MLVQILAVVSSGRRNQTYFCLMRYRGSKTPLFSALRRLIQAAAQKSDEQFLNEQKAQVSPHHFPVSRREFLKGIGGAAALMAIGGSPVTIQKRTAPKIVIVGGGIAGLNTAYYLKKAGIQSQIYEGSSRVGGRIFSVKDALGPGLVTEFGGEFIDSTHREMFTLAKEFGLKFEDRKSDAEKTLIPRTYFFTGARRSEAEVIEGIKPFLESIRNDAGLLPQNFDFKNPGNAGSFDTISLAEYFYKLEVSGWIKDLLEVAYVSEFGLELADQSALNFITFVSTDITEEFRIFGTSDERYKIQGGNGSIVSKLSDLLQDRIHLSHHLEAIKNRSKGFTLTFRNENSVKEIDADIVLLAIPFSVLRNIDMKIELPPWKKKAITELGYGTNSKIMTGFTKRLWREQGFLGEVFSDDHFQLAWDNSEFQIAEAGGMTSFNGGKRGLEAGSNTVEYQADMFLQGLDKVFPGISQVRNGKNQRFHWPSYPFTKGSYAAYKPGQWTTIRGAEGAPVGNLFFAGEHCSLEFQGFMNGGAETGRKAAEDIMKLLD